MFLLAQFFFTEKINPYDAQILRCRKNWYRWLCFISWKLQIGFCCKFEVLFILPWCIYSPNFTNTLITIWEIFPLQFMPSLKNKKRVWIKHELAIMIVNVLSAHWSHILAWRSLIDYFYLKRECNTLVRQIISI